MTAPNDNPVSNPPVQPSPPASPAAPVAGQGMDAATAENQKAYQQAKVTLIIELLFVVVPFGVMFIVLSLNGKTGHMLQLSEFSFAGIILAGQALTKYISGALAKRRTDNNAPSYSVLISVAAGLLILFAGLVLYRIVEIKEVSESDLSTGLMIWQGVIFVVGILMFIFLGGAGEVATIRYEKH